MTEKELQKIKEHIEIHARREPFAIKITQILWKAVEELEAAKKLEIENNNLSKRILELQGDKGRLIEEINDWKARADKAYSEKANAEIKLDEAKEIIREFCDMTLIFVPPEDKEKYTRLFDKAEAFLKE